MVGAERHALLIVFGTPTSVHGWIPHFRETKAADRPSGTARWPGHIEHDGFDVVPLLRQQLCLTGKFGFHRSLVQSCDIVAISMLLAPLLDRIGPEHQKHSVPAGRRVEVSLDDPVVCGFAQNVVVFQRSELGTMSTYMSDRNTSRLDHDPQRTLMAWMGMSTTLSTMPGMGSEDDLAQFGEARGGGSTGRSSSACVPITKAGSTYQPTPRETHPTPRVRDLAARMARNRSIEVREYDAHMARLDVTSRS